MKGIGQFSGVAIERINSNNVRTKYEFIFSIVTKFKIISKIILNLLYFAPKNMGQFIFKIFNELYTTFCAVH